MKQGKIDFKTLGYILLILIGVYLAMRFADAIAGFFGLSLFSNALAYINYILLLIVWIILQVALFYGYYSVFRWAFKGFNFLINKLFNLNSRIQNLIITHH
jgi:hypothetical protein